jgi:hypothetical protein
VALPCPHSGIAWDPPLIQIQHKMTYLHAGSVHYNLFFLPHILLHLLPWFWTNLNLNNLLMYASISRSILSSQLCSFSVYKRYCQPVSSNGCNVQIFTKLNNRWSTTSRWKKWITEKFLFTRKLLYLEPMLVLTVFRDIFSHWITRQIHSTAKSAI